MNKQFFSIFYTDDDFEDRILFESAAEEVSDALKLTMQSSGNELLKLLNQMSSIPNVLFLDLNMPEMNGYEVLKEVRQLEHAKNLPIIIFSTSNDETAIKESRRLGANLYITKPSSYSNLKKVIADVMRMTWDKQPAALSDFVYRY